MKRRDCLPCTAKKKSGEPCTLFAQQGSRFCFWHDPSKATDRIIAASRGGRSTMGKSNTLPDAEFKLDSATSISTLLESTANSVLKGSLDTRRGQCVAYICTVALKSLEASALESRLAALEARLHGKTIVEDVKTWN